MDAHRLALDLERLGHLAEQDSQGCDRFPLGLLQGRDEGALGGDGAALLRHFQDRQGAGAVLRFQEAQDVLGVLQGRARQAQPVARGVLADWIARRLDRQGQRASVETLRFLADRVEGNLLAAQQEVMKLALLAPPGELARAEIESAVASVARYDFEWQIGYILEEPMLLPPGTRIEVEAHMDNSEARARKFAKVDAGRAVRWGLLTTDEMMHGFVTWSPIDEAEAQRWAAAHGAAPSSGQ